MVIDRRADEAGLRSFDALFGPDGIGIVPLSAYQAELARAAWKRYGRGSGHKAQLNFGDCMAYALARESGEPLLFKGNDFIHTDITPALRD
jgi:ribonuclease VapC